MMLITPPLRVAHETAACTVTVTAIVIARHYFRGAMPLLLSSATSRC